MAKIETGGVTSPMGFTAGAVAAGIRDSDAADLAILYSDRPAQVAGAFTANTFAAAPVQYDREICRRGKTVRAILANSGNANACTGPRGMADTRQAAAWTATALQLAQPADVLVCSTGIIGKPLPMDCVQRGIDQAAARLSDSGGSAAAQAIMTTDTCPKEAAIRLKIGERTITLGGMAKGAGMIAPHLVPEVPHATMLAFITTDATLSPAFLQTCLKNSLDESFNRITIDGDTSTNDTFLVLANGAAGNDPIQPDTPEAQAFEQALDQLAAHLAKSMVKDGEGATRFVEVQVTGAVHNDEARRCAAAIANSLLCKTAWFGADPNWGRILDAAGYAGVHINVEQTALDYAGIPLVRQGMPVAVDTEKLQQAAAAKDLQLTLDLGAGTGQFVMWTCDLSYDYVRINAEYHT